MLNLIKKYVAIRYIVINIISGIVFIISNYLMYGFSESNAIYNLQRLLFVPVVWSEFSLQVFIYIYYYLFQKYKNKKSAVVIIILLVLANIFGAYIFQFNPFEPDFALSSYSYACITYSVLVFCDVTWAAFKPRSSLNKKT